MTRGGRVLATGVNIDKNHPKVLDENDIKYHASVHAEARVLKQIADPRGCTVYVARLMKDGTAGNSEPCGVCYNLLKSSGVRKVIYT